MSKKEEDQMTGSREDDEGPDMLEPEPPPGRISSSNVPPSGGDAAPRAARFGEGPEGRGGRRERGVSGPRQNFIGRAGQFLHDVRSELKRVTWPTATEVKNTTIITIVAVIFFAIYLWSVDRVFTFLITQLGRLIESIF